MNKKRRFAVVALVAVMSLAFALVAVGCAPKGPAGIPADAELASLAFDAASPAAYVVGENLDRTNTRLTATYQKGGTEYKKAVALSEVSATIAFAGGEAKTLTDPYKFNEEGEYALNATFTDSERAATAAATLAITVGQYDVTVSTFGLPTAYKNFKDDYPEDYAENREGVDKLMVAPGEYVVGNDNAFEFVPVATGFKEGEGEVTLGTVLTDVKMSIKDGSDYRALGETEEATYVTVDTVRNYYRFTEKAEGYSFRAEITLDPNYGSDLDEEDKTITADFKVESGYNVYDEFGLSVLDNLNVKMWRELKNRTLPWDDKPLYEYTNVEKVILHNDITINPDNLPDYYFWDATRDADKGYNAAHQALQSGDATQNMGYADKLAGSLRDYSTGDSPYWYPGDSVNGEYAEEYPINGNPQKGIYNSYGIGISGNGMAIGYTTKGERHALYSVYNHDDAGSGEPKASVIGHWSLISYANDDVYNSKDAMDKAITYKNDDPMIENVRFVGNMPRKATDPGQPAQLAAVHSRRNPNLKNCVITKMYIAVICELADGDKSPETNATVENCKLCDIYNNVLYTWRGSMTIKNSVIKEAGGPIAILCDADRNAETEIGEGAPPTPKLFLEGNNELEANASGYEPWYQANDATTAFTNVSGTLSGAASVYLGKNITVGTTDVEGQSAKSMLNVIALLIPSTGSIFKNFDQPGDVVPYTQGQVIMKSAGDGGTDITYDLNIRNTTTAFSTAHSQGAPIFVYKDLSAYFAGSSCNDATNASASKTAWQAVDFDKMMIIVKAGQASTYPSFGVFLGGVTNVSAS